MLWTLHDARDVNPHFKASKVTYTPAPFTTSMVFQLNKLISRTTVRNLLGDSRAKPPLTLGVSGRAWLTPDQRSEVALEIV